jgi:hypothetical protein
MSKSILLAVIFLCFSVVGYAQQLEFSYEGIGDNREYFSGRHVSETILGSRLAMNLGFSIDSVHQVKAGLAYFYEYGTKLGELSPWPVLYYAYQNQGSFFNMGVMPRNEVLNYPLAILSDRYGYYRAAFEGLSFGVGKPAWHIHTWADWVSRQDSLRREQFMAGANGDVRFGRFTVEGWGYLFHNAFRIHRPEGESIEDNFGGLLLAGYDFADYLPLDQLSIKAGVLHSVFRNRGVSKDFDHRLSAYFQFDAVYERVGLHAVFHRGNKHYFEYGDLFFRNANSYLKAGAFVNLFQNKSVTGRFSWFVHATPGEIDHQQQLSLVWRLGMPLKR